MHTCEEVGIAVETVQDLEASFAWTPPLSAEPRDADDLLAGPESISPKILLPNLQLSKN
ncbi:uncharacterized protein EDB93DRAFT_899478 [Suillus bovinus]|uniref:uncharacterized protein n=1 Tax=Suillus bovinus TaxID=48563 RepID=UPI001B861006|nr:uncharacterized protein EDB93DRAFT_899478 [Suillus bovinus]KAG2132734.1 hypothetical protein EDB93DRAFT_899478 [Suillus bovinus]